MVEMEIEFKNIFGNLDHPNRNGLIYPPEVIKEAIDKWKKNGRKYGELNPNYEEINKDNLRFGPRVICEETKVIDNNGNSIKEINKINEIISIDLL